MRSDLIHLLLVICLVLPIDHAWSKQKPKSPLSPYETAQAAYDKNDLVTALMIWLPLAEAGDKNAQFNLGKIHLKHDHADNALYWLQMAADQGHLDSQTYLGLLYTEGKDIKKNPQLAAKYLLLATRNQQAMSRYTPTISTKKTDQKQSKLSDYQKGMQAYKQKDFARALMLWLPLGKAADPQAEYMIGKMYLEQTGPGYNPAKAAHWFTRAADHGHLQAQTALGTMYFEGELIGRDLPQAAKWLLKASRNDQQVVIPIKKKAKTAKKKKAKTAKKSKLKTLPAFNKGMIAYQKKDYASALMHWYPLGMKNHANAQLMLGNLYMREQGIYKDPVKGLAWYQRAISQDDIATTKSLGLMYLYGDDIKMNSGKAVNLLLKAARQGDVESQYTLGNVYLSGKIITANPPKAAYWFQQAAKSKHANSQYALANMYMQGKGIKQSPKKALKLYKQADKSNHKQSTVMLAKHAYHDTKKPNHKQAFKLFSKAAKQDEPEAQYYLGEMHFNGQATAKDLKQAFNWYTKSAEQSFAHAEYSLGKMYVNGYGVKHNYTKGVDYFSKAAQKGFGPAQYDLGVAYYSGQGVKRDMVAAYTWFYLATQKSIKDASKNRQVVYKSLTDADKKRANALVAKYMKLYH